MNRLLLPSVFFLTAWIVDSAVAQSWQDEVNLAIDRGVESLLRRQKPDGSFGVEYPHDYLDKEYPGGGTALALYALLKSDVPPSDPIVVRAVDSLRYVPFQKVYTVGCTIMALDALHDPAHDEFIRRAAQWLETNIHAKSRIWAYPSGAPELSNSQYGALGLWAAAKHGYRAKPETWADLVTGSLKFQNQDGGFFYRTDSKSESYGSMTVAGITVVHLAVQSLEGNARFASVRRAGTEALERAWAYLDRVFSAVADPGMPSGFLLDQSPGNFNRYPFIHFYYLYGLERVASFFARKEIAGRDWYEEGAHYLLKHEGADGGWGHLIDTSFALLFLKRATLSSMDVGQATAGVGDVDRISYTFDAPSGEWASPAFDDSAWPTSFGAFGSGGAGGGIFRTEWKTKEIWLRRRFSHQEEKSENLRVYVLHDDDAKLYLNGVLAADLPGYSQNAYRAVDCSKESIATLKQGQNVLALYVKNAAGAQSADLRLKDVGLRLARKGESEDAARRRYWKARPKADVPFVTEWLQLGPIQDPDGMKFTADLLHDSEAAPKKGTKALNQTWKKASAPGGRLDFLADGRKVDRAFFYAFTEVSVQEDTRALLWCGADDGYRILWDGKVIASNFYDRATDPDSFVRPIRLGAGRHRLLVKVWNRGGPCSLAIRITGVDGQRHPGVKVLLGDDAEDRLDLARSSAGEFTPAELLAILPAEAIDRIEFVDQKDLDRLAIGGTAFGRPKWVGTFDSSGPAPQPPPGARGLLLVAPAERSVPAVLWRRVKPAAARSIVQVTIAANAKSADPPKTGARVRIGVYAADREPRWIADLEIRPSQKPRAEDWKKVTADLSEWLDQDVLLAFEISQPATVDDANVFIDEITLRSAK